MTLKTPGWVPAAVAAAAMTLGACQLDRHEIVGSVPVDYRTTHPIIVGEGLKTFDIPVGPSTAMLSDQARGNVAGIGQRFLASGSSTLILMTPSGSVNAVAAARMSGDVQRVLIQSGVPAGVISRRVYPAGQDETNAPIRLAFSAITATTNGCGPWPDNLAKHSENRNYYNFGCATQSNLAAMVSNPVDLIQPRATQPADAERRSTVLEAYRGGKSPATDHGSETGGQVATGVGN